MAVNVASGPTGIERIVAPDELFFSTGDGRGVIRFANSVCVRISGYPLPELVGSPHSLVRHPDMPGGAFRLMWDRLLAGRPVGAFVQNVAKDGSHYWVFATVTPLDEGFLSVQLAPRSDLFEPARQLYAEVRAAERRAMSTEGLDRRAAAELGARLLEEGVQGLGFDSYDDYVLEVLPAEIAARERPVTASFARPWLRGPIAEVLAGVRALDAQLGDQVVRLDLYRTLCERLLAAASGVLDVARRLDRSVGAAQRASGEVAETAPVLVNVSTVMAQPMHITVTALERLAPQLRRLRTDLAGLRFRIALASLHNDMVAAVVAEVADGVAPPRALEEVPQLCDAVQDGVLEMSRTARSVNGELADAAQLVAEAGERLDEFRRFLGQWRILVMRHRAAVALGDLLRPIDEEIAAGHQGMHLLRTLGEECRAGTVPLDAGTLQVEVERIREAATSA